MRRPPHARTFFVKDLLLDLIDGVGGFDIERDRLANEGLDEDLHRAATTMWHTKQAQPTTHDPTRSDSSFSFFF